MPHFGTTSQTRLATCDPRLQGLFNEVVQHWACMVLEGRRAKERQNYLHSIGQSHLEWPHSKNNVMHPDGMSKAVCVAPWYPDEGVPWDDFKRFNAFGGFVLGVAAMMDLHVRWGGNWTGDRLFLDQKSYDLPYYELLD